MMAITTSSSMSVNAPMGDGEFPRLVMGPLSIPETCSRQANSGWRTDRVISHQYVPEHRPDALKMKGGKAVGMVAD
jgi:hypothetical protein